MLKQLNPKLKVIFASPDKGRQAKNNIWCSEWGSEDKPTKDRLLAEHYLDGVYINNKGTCLGGKIKNLEALPYDLSKWFLEIKKEE